MNAERKQREVSRFGHTQLERFLQQEKMATEAGFTPSEGAANNNGGGAENNAN